MPPLKGVSVYKCSLIWSQRETQLKLKTYSLKRKRYLKVSSLFGSFVDHSICQSDKFAAIAFANEFSKTFEQKQQLA
jgi:hypothetical protein